MNSPRILIAASMNGGAEAVAPVANRLRERKIPCQVLLSGAAERNLKDFRGEADVKNQTTSAFCSALIKTYAPTTILTGTQVQSKEGPVTLEQMLWEAGREAGIRAIAVMDTWGNEAERFSDLETGVQGRTAAIVGKLTRMPEIITAIDEYQKRVMLAQGFPEDNIRVAGNPYFEKVAAEFATLSPGTREELLAKPVFSNFHPDGKTIVFMSDTMAGYPDIGFTEKSVLQSFLRIMDELAKRTGMKINVIVRPHPFRNQDAADAFNCETPNIRKVLHNPVSARGGDPQNEYSMEQLLYAVNLVVGTFNNPLVTAKICGRPVIHWLPGIKPGYEFQLFMSEQGMSHRLTDGRELGEMMLAGFTIKLIEGSIQQKPMDSAHGAIDRVIALL